MEHKYIKTSQKRFFALLTCAFACIFLSLSCSNDNNSDGGVKVDASKLVGTWQEYKTVITAVPTTEIQGGSSPKRNRYTFKQQNIFSSEFGYNYGGNRYRWSKASSGKYSTKGSKLILTHSDGTRETFRITYFDSYEMKIDFKYKEDGVKYHVTRYLRKNDNPREWS